MTVTDKFPNVKLQQSVSNWQVISTETAPNPYKHTDILLAAGSKDESIKALLNASISERVSHI